MAKKNTSPAKPIDPESSHLHLIFGEDDFLAHQAADKVVNALCPPAEQALGMEIIDADATNSDDAIQCIKQAISGLRTLSFFGGRKVVWLRGATFFGANFRSSDALKNTIALLKDELSNGLGDDQFLVISALGMDSEARL